MLHCSMKDFAVQSSEDGRERYDFRLGPANPALLPHRPAFSDVRMEGVTGGLQVDEGYCPFADARTSLMSTSRST